MSLIFRSTVILFFACAVTGLSVLSRVEAAGPRFGLRCMVKTVQVDERDLVEALLDCKSELVNVRTRSPVKALILAAAKQNESLVVVDVGSTAQGRKLELDTIFLPE